MSKTREQRREHWQRLVAEQAQSGLSVRAFCQRHEASEFSFYQWRKRLAQPSPVKFALVHAGHGPSAGVEAVEVVLTSGERLRIADGVNAATLRLVLSVLREAR